MSMTQQPRTSNGPRWVTAPASSSPPQPTTTTSQQHHLQQQRQQQQSSSLSPSIASTSIHKQALKSADKHPHTATAPATTTIAASSSAQSTPRTTPVLSQLSIATAQSALASLPPDPTSPTHKERATPVATSAASTTSASVAAVATSPPIATVQRRPSEPTTSTLERVSPSPPTLPQTIRQPPPAPLTVSIPPPPRVAAAATTATQTSTPTRDPAMNGVATSTAGSATSSRRRAAATVTASPPPLSPLVSSSRQAAQAAARAIRSSASTATPPPTFARIAHNTSSPVPMPPSDMSQPEAGPSTHGSVAGTEAETSNIADPPKPKKRRRGWKGWAIEVEDEFGRKYLRSPSPEPDRPVDAPPRKRGRPRTRPREPEEQKPEEHPASEATEATTDAGAARENGGERAPQQPPAPESVADTPAATAGATAGETTRPNGELTSTDLQQSDPAPQTEEQAINEPMDFNDYGAADEPLPSPAVSEPTQRNKQPKPFMRFQVGAPKRARKSSPPVPSSEAPESKRPRASMPAAVHSNGKERASASSSKAPRRSEPGPATNGRKADGPSSSKAANGKSAAASESAQSSSSRRAAEKPRPQTASNKQTSAKDKASQRTLHEYFGDEPQETGAPRLGMGAAYPSPPESDERHERGEDYHPHSEVNGNGQTASKDSPSSNARTRPPLPDVQEEARLIISLAAKRREEDGERGSRKEPEHDDPSELMDDIEVVEPTRRPSSESGDRHERNRHREREEAAARERLEWERTERERREHDRREYEKREEWERERLDERERHLRERELRKREEWENRGEWRGPRDDNDRGRIAYDERGREVIMRDERGREYLSREPRHDHRANGRSQPYYPPPPPHEYHHSSKSAPYYPPFDRGRPNSSYHQPQPFPGPYPPYPSPSHANAPLHPDGRSDMDWNMPPGRHGLPPPSAMVQGPSGPSTPHGARPSSRGIPPPLQSPLMSGPPPLGPPPLMQQSPTGPHGAMPLPMPQQPMPNMHPGMVDPRGQHLPHDRRDRRQSEQHEYGDRRVSSHTVRPERHPDHVPRASAGPHDLFPELHPDVHMDPRDPRAHRPRAPEQRDVRPPDARPPRERDPRMVDPRMDPRMDPRGGDPRSSLKLGGYTDVVPVPFPTGPAYRAPEPRLPRAHPEEPIVLAQPGNQHPTPTKRSDLPFARAHANGYEGLDPGLEENARGFVENVKNNLRTLVQTYFIEPSASRDAFLERIGRDLTSFGWELTDGADGALYSRGPPHREVDGSPVEHMREMREHPGR